jgi:hypothetical protein
MYDKQKHDNKTQQQQSFANVGTSVGLPRLSRQITNLIPHG